MKKQDPNKVQSIKEIMEQMGFKKDAPASTQEAFMKHLVKSAYKNVAVLDLSKNKKEEDNQLDLFDDGRWRLAAD